MHISIFTQKKGFAQPQLVQNVSVALHSTFSDFFPILNLFFTCGLAPLSEAKIKELKFGLDCNFLNCMGFEDLGKT